MQFNSFVKTTLIVLLIVTIFLLLTTGILCGCAALLFGLGDSGTGRIFGWCAAFGGVFFLVSLLGLIGMSVLAQIASSDANVPLNNLFMEKKVEENSTEEE